MEIQIDTHALERADERGTAVTVYVFYGKWEV
jgi:hypothetical protein